MKTFAPQRLRDAREDRRLSRPALAAQAGVGARYIKSLESGDRANPSLDVMARLAAALELTLDQLAN